jgi:hypothetical protein
MLGFIAFGMLALFSAGSQDVTAASAKPCTEPDMLALLASTDPVYVRASELAERLSRNGLPVRCMLQSRRGGMFEGLEGAVLFRTEHGSFEALFLPKGQTFAELEVVERREDGRYLYSFTGSPKPVPEDLVIDSAEANDYIKFGDRLLMVLGDRPFTNRLIDNLTKQPR